MRVMPVATALALLATACDPPINFRPTANFDRESFLDDEYRCNTGVLDVDEDTFTPFAQAADESLTCETIEFSVFLEDKEEGELVVKVRATDGPDGIARVLTDGSVVVSEEDYGSGAPIVVQVQPIFWGGQVLNLFAHDGTQNSSGDVFPIKINARPSNPTVVWSPAVPVPGQPLTATIDTFSEDPDTKTLSHRLILTSSVSGTIAGTLNESVEVIPGDRVVDGERWTADVEVVEVDGNDGITPLPTGWAFTWPASEVFVGGGGNAAPGAPTVELTPDPATAGSDMSCDVTIDAVDAEDGTLGPANYSYAWDVDGPTSFNTQSLSAADLSGLGAGPGSAVRCTVTATDSGGLSGPPADSQTVTLADGAIDISTDPFVLAIDGHPGAQLGYEGGGFSVDMLGGTNTVALGDLFANPNGQYGAGEGAVRIYTGADIAGGTDETYDLVGPPGANFGASVFSLPNMGGAGVHGLAVGSQNFAELAVFHGGDLAVPGVYAQTPGGGDSHWNVLTMSHVSHSGSPASLGKMVVSGEFMQQAGKQDLAILANDNSAIPPSVYVIANDDLGGPVDLSGKRRIDANQGNLMFWGVSMSAGDVLTDGDDDLIIGTPDGLSPQNALVCPATDLLIDTVYAESDFIALTGSAGEEAGFAVAALGSGHFAVSAPGMDFQRGQVRVYTGSQSMASVDWVTDSVSNMQGVNTGDRFGEALTAVGDIDGDGISELAVSAIGEDLGKGRVRLYMSADLTAGGTPSPAFTFTGEADNHFLSALGWVGDVEGDGAPEILLGSGEANSNTGRAYLFDPVWD